MVISAIAGLFLGLIPAWPATARSSKPSHFDRRVYFLLSQFAYLFLQIAKGAVAASIASMLWGPWWIPYIAVGFAMAGDAFPIIFRSRLRSPLLIWVGGMLVLSPIPVLLAAVTGGLFWIGSRQNQYGLAVGFVAFPPILTLFGSTSQVVVSFALLIVVGIYLLYRDRLNRAVLSSSQVQPAFKP